MGIYFVYPLKKNVTSQKFFSRILQIVRICSCRRRNCNKPSRHNTPSAATSCGEQNDNQIQRSSLRKGSLTWASLGCFLRHRTDPSHSLDNQTRRQRRLVCCPNLISAPQRTRRVSPSFVPAFSLCDSLCRSSIRRNWNHVWSERPKEALQNT